MNEIDNIINNSSDHMKVRAFNSAWHTANSWNNYRIDPNYFMLSLASHQKMVKDELEYLMSLILYSDLDYDDIVKNSEPNIFSLMSGIRPKSLMDRIVELGLEFEKLKAERYYHAKRILGFPTLPDVIRDTIEEELWELEACNTADLVKLWAKDMERDKEYEFEQMSKVVEKVGGLDKLTVEEVDNYIPALLTHNEETNPEIIMMLKDDVEETIDAISEIIEKEIPYDESGFWNGLVAKLP